MPRRTSSRAVAIRRRRATLILGVLAGAIVILSIALATGGGPRRLLPGAGGGHGTIDPLAYDPSRHDELERLAARGLSHVIYAKSPGGAVLSAKRTLRFRAAAQAAARNGPVGADTLLAIVMLESAGRPDAVAGDDPAAAAGLTQIVAETGRDLLGMHVNLAASRRDARGIARALAAGRTRRAAKLEAARRRSDERFDPRKALAATERYLAIAKRHLGGREDLAIASYHMGIGNLQTALARYGGGGGVGYARLFFDSTPLHHPRAYAFLASLGDDSRTYLWRVLAAKEILRLAREDPGALDREAALQTSADSAELALRPIPGTPTLKDPGEVAQARSAGELVPVRLAAEGIAAPPGALLTPAALDVARTIGAGVRAVAHTRARLRIVAATAPRSDPAPDYDPLHATGFAFDVSRRYASPAQAQAFQFMLDRLQAFDAIAWARHGDVVHITVGPDASGLAG